MSIKNELKKIYAGKKVFLTGHTGFKGSWLTLILQELGAEVFGYSLAPNTNPSHYELLKLELNETIADIRDLQALKTSLSSFAPDIVFHLAAQPLVIASYENPVETYETNVMGTINLLEACRSNQNIKAIVNITTDKVYKNQEWHWPYREDDVLGGHDPYSNSKSCSELVTDSFQKSFFSLSEYKKSHQCLIATARGGNVIGGGDWAANRIIPDIIKSITTSSPLEIRSPHSIRPWQHVLEPLYGYLLLGSSLLKQKKDHAGAWNFGPEPKSFVSVQKLTQQVKEQWEKFDYKEGQEKQHESKILKLDSSKAIAELKWANIWDFERSVSETVNWYRAFYEEKRLITREQINSFLEE